MGCDLELELENHKFRLRSYPGVAGHLRFEVPSLAGALCLAGQLSRGELRQFLQMIGGWGCFDHIRVDLNYRGKTLTSRTLPDYLGLDALWFLSKQWARLFGGLP